MTMLHHRWVTLLAATVGFAAPQLMADPPARVGRLNLINGSVSFRAASVDEWAVAEPNRTLTTGDRIWTDHNSRAELHVGSTAIRLSAQTEFDFVNVDDQTVQARLAQGTATIRVRGLDDGEVYEIDTPNGAVSLGSAGLYRIDVSDDGTRTKVAVWDGGAEVTSAGSSFQINPHQVATINGTDSPTYDLADIGAPDDWDSWSLDRDHREDNAVSARYVSRDMPGYEDLDDYGHWSVVADYGNVWVPDHVDPGWAPYHTGHWVWVDPWGWSWVDSAPWGYAPYHYGRWGYADGRWFWSPGPPPPPPGQVIVVERPVYAPALVAFVGGPGWRVGVATGGVAWVALGIGEPYRPAYAVSPRYVDRVNYTSTTVVRNTTIINNTTVVNNVTINNYRNSRAPGAVMAVRQDAMASGQPVQRVGFRPTRQELAGAPRVSEAPSVVPTRAAVTGGAAFAGRAPGVPPSAISNRTVVAKTAPPPAAVPFAAKQQALAANGGRPLAPARETEIRQTLPRNGAAGAQLVRPASMVSNNGALRPARAGIVAAAPVQAAGGNGFVSHATAAQQNRAVGLAAAQAARPQGFQAGGTAPGGAVNPRPGVPQPPAGQRVGGNAPGGVQPGGAQAATPQRVGGNQPGGNRPGGNQPGGQPGGAQPGGVPRPNVAQPATPQRVGGNQPGGNQPGGNQPGGDPRPNVVQPSTPQRVGGGNQPGGNQPGGDPRPNVVQPATPQRVGGGNQPGGNQPGGDPRPNVVQPSTPQRAGGNQPGGNQPGGDPRPNVVQPATPQRVGGNQPGGNQLGGNQPGEQAGGARPGAIAPRPNVVQPATPQRAGGNQPGGNQPGGVPRANVAQPPNAQRGGGPPGPGGQATGTRVQAPPQQVKRAPQDNNNKDNKDRKPDHK